ncbi:MAG: bifunctional 3-deoxy-7-phosphoheptulonate synthase/chorismate mutase [Planctomycetes bacterium]|nr:bifunctional 3-deoxy-7-phosphoheptulonate synthase/chorismate mutase [Planctomycetota bacterium]
MEPLLPNPDNPGQQNNPDADSPRQRIDLVDKELIRLLRQRMDAVHDIAQHKSNQDEAQLFDPDREAEVANEWAEESQNLGLSSYFTGRILREVLNYSRRSQEPLLSEKPKTTTCRVGYQGVATSYSDLAIEKLFAHRTHSIAEHVGLSSFADVFTALERGEIDYGLLPVENTLIGSISEVNHLLATRDIAVVDEEVWEVEHCLAALPGAEVADLRIIRSHAVALQQCQRLLGDIRQAKAAHYFDTAGAAQSVRDAKDPKIGCICSSEAAERFGLNVLRRDVADHAHNQTRFLLLATKPENASRKMPSKTTIHFAVEDRCGALSNSLAAFSDHGVNLVRLESRPQPETPWEYMFLADLAGHQEDENVQEALAALRSSCNHVQVLGTYPSRAVEHRLEPSKIPSTLWKAKVETPAKVTIARHVKAKPRPSISVGGVAVGGGNFTLILGPCAVESRKQIRDTAAMVKARGAQIMRGGAFKPRSSPHSFQGLGFEGLDLLVEAGREFEMPVVTEVLQPEDVEAIAAKADMLQVGARNMQNFSLLKQLGKIRRPVLLKRGMSATLKELLQAAEYIKAGGNQRVILCERGIRTFETATRNTLDISAVPVLKTMTDLPIIVDPSHAAGQRHLVVPLALAAVAAGADGIIVECHPRPEEALCDKEQALRDQELDLLMEGLRPILAAQGRL